MLNVLLTGSTGFVGRAVLRTLLNQAATKALSVAVAIRRKQSLNCPEYVVGELSASNDWSDALLGQDVVIHAAGRAHVLQENVANPQQEYFRVNTDATLNLAQQAADAGVKRFIFISTIGVNGNASTHPFTEADSPEPSTLYAKSKWAAEKGLWDIQKNTGMEIVIIRPPLAYGPGAPGNFGRLVRVMEKGLLLPLGGLKNKRSLIAIENLVDVIVTCVDHPSAANELFLVSDGEDLSTTELLKGVANGLGKPARLLPCPAWVVMFFATMVGKKNMANQLTGTLQVDSTKARTKLGWVPPVTVEEGLSRCFKRG